MPWTKEQAKAYYAEYYRKNREKKLAAAKARAEAHPELRREEQRRFREQNAERLRAQKAEWQRSEAGKVSVARSKAKWEATPEGRASRRASDARRRARQRNLDCGCVTKDALHAVWEHDGGWCYACGDPGEHFDHVVALLHGGPHCVANLRVACARCNNTKNSRPLEYLLERLREQGVALSPRLHSPALPCSSSVAA